MLFLNIRDTRVGTDKQQYTLTLTEETNWMGPDGVVKDIVMLINDNIIGMLLPFLQLSFGRC